LSSRDIGASVRQCLLNQARAQARPFQELLQYFAMERFLYRLGVSPVADRFVLKGALLLTTWQAPLLRPTGFSLNLAMKPRASILALFAQVQKQDSLVASLVAGAQIDGQDAAAASGSLRSAHEAIGAMLGGLNNLEVGHVKR
jgi:hypothetical protein